MNNENDVYPIVSTDVMDLFFEICTLCVFTLKQKREERWGWLTPLSKASAE